MGSFRQKAKSIGQIAAASALELESTPAIMLLVLAGLLLVSFIPLFQFHSFGEAGRLCRDGALAYQLTVGSLISVCGAAFSIRRELGSGTALAVLSKPVSRTGFLVGKWIGVLAVTSKFWLATLCCGLVAWRVPERMHQSADGAAPLADNVSQAALLLLPAVSLLAGAAANRLKGARFALASTRCMVAGSFALAVFMSLLTRDMVFSPSPGNIDKDAIAPSFLILLSLAVYSSIAAALSTAIKGAAVGLVLLVLMALGLSWDGAINAFGPIAALPVPNLQSFWVCGYAADGGLPPGYLPVSCTYAAALSAAAMALGSILFSKRDIS